MLIQVYQMKSKTLFYLILFYLSITVTAINDSETKSGSVLDSHNNGTATPLIDAQVPSNNKPLLIKGPTLDIYNQNKDLKVQQKPKEAIAVQTPTKSERDNLSSSSTNIKTIEPSAKQPIKTQASQETFPVKLGNSSKTVDQAGKKTILQGQPTEINSKQIPPAEQVKKKEEKLKTQAIEEKIQRQNLPKLKQSQNKVVPIPKQTKLVSKEEAMQNKVVSSHQQVQKQQKAKKEAVQAKNNVVEVILSHPDEEKIQDQILQPKEIAGSKQSPVKPIKNDNRTIQIPISNASKVQKAPTQQIKIISLEQQTEESEQDSNQPSKQKKKAEEIVASIKVQPQLSKKTIQNDQKDRKESNIQPQLITKAQEKQLVKENTNNSSQKIQQAIRKQLQTARQKTQKGASMQRTQLNNKELPQQKKAKPQKEVTINKEVRPKVQQPLAQPKSSKHVESKLIQVPQAQIPSAKINQSQPKVQSNHGDKDAKQKVQNTKAQQKKDSDKPSPILESRKQQVIESAKELKQPDLKQLLEQVKLDMGEKAKINVIKHLQDQIKHLQTQIKQTEKAKAEASLPLKVQKQVKEQHLKQQQPIKPEVKEEQSSEQVMDTSTILVIIVMTFIISIPIFREIKIKQNTPQESSRKQVNGPASAAQESNQRLELQFTDLDNQTGCAIGEPIDQQQR